MRLRYFTGNLHRRWLSVVATGGDCPEVISLQDKGHPLLEILVTDSLQMSPYPRPDLETTGVCLTQHHTPTPETVHIQKLINDKFKGPFPLTQFKKTLKDHPSARAPWEISWGYFWNCITIQLLCLILLSSHSHRHWAQEYSIIKFLHGILHLGLSMDLDQRQFPVVSADSTYVGVNGGPDAWRQGAS